MGADVIVLILEASGWLQLLYVAVHDRSVCVGAATAVKVKVKQSLYRPGQAQRVLKEVKVPRFRDNGTGWW